MDRSAMPWRVLEQPEAGDSVPPAAAPGKPPGEAGSTGRGPHSGPGNGGADRNARPLPHGLDASRARLVAIGAGLVLLLLAGAAAAILGTDRPRQVSAETASSVASAPATAARQIVVDVTGAVLHPGVYRLAADSRVADALAAAGGYAPGVDPVAASRLVNLAAPLKDGEQIRVPAREDSAAASRAGAGASSAGAGPESSRSLIDLNRADAAGLDALPGIGPVTAAKIVASREAEPFRSIRDLVTRKLVSQSTFDKLSALVTVG